MISQFFANSQSTCDAFSKYFLGLFELSIIFYWASVIGTKKILTHVSQTAFTYTVPTLETPDRLVFPFLTLDK